MRTSWSTQIIITTLRDPCESLHCFATMRANCIVSTPAVAVEDNPARHRYEILVGGTVAGFADYAVVGDIVVLPHTVVDPAFRGRGLAAQLVRRALDDARHRGQLVDPQCSYAARFFDDHPEYGDLRAS